MAVGYARFVVGSSCGVVVVVVGNTCGVVVVVVGSVVVVVGCSVVVVVASVVVVVASDVVVVASVVVVGDTGPLALSVVVVAAAGRPDVLAACANDDVRPCVPKVVTTGAAIPTAAIRFMNERRSCSGAVSSVSLISVPPVARCAPNIT